MVNFKYLLMIAAITGIYANAPAALADEPNPKAQETAGTGAEQKPKAPDGVQRWLPAVMLGYKYQAQANFLSPPAGQKIQSLTASAGSLAAEVQNIRHDGHSLVRGELLTRVNIGQGSSPDKKYIMMSSDFTTTMQAGATTLAAHKKGLGAYVLAGLEGEYSFRVAPVDAVSGYYYKVAGSGELGGDDHTRAARERSYAHGDARRDCGRRS